MAYIGGNKQLLKATIIGDYSAGYKAGNEAGTDAGKQAERAAFWEVYQNGGRRNEYRNAFFAWNWQDDIYNPIYPIKCEYNSSSMFQYNTSITDTKVDIIFSHVSSTNVFNGCSKLKRIRKLIVTEDVKYSGWFTGCTALENIVFEGVIGSDIDLSATAITYEVAEPILRQLKDFFTAGMWDPNTSDYKCEILLPSVTWERLNNYVPPNDLGYNTWNEYLYSIGWKNNYI